MINQWLSNIGNKIINIPGIGALLNILMSPFRFMSILFQKYKKLPLFLIAITIILFTAYKLFSHHFYHAYVTGISEDMIYKIESKLLDFKFKRRGPSESTKKVGILAIDEKSIVTFGQYPFNRRYYEQAFRNLKTMGVKVIGFDVVYAEPQKALLEDGKTALDAIKRSPVYIKESLKKIESMIEVSPADKGLSTGIEEFENIVMGYFYFITEWETNLNLGDNERFPRLDSLLDSEVQLVDMPEGKTLDDYGVLKPKGMVTNYDTITQSGSNFGFFSNEADEDAINRWVTLLVNIEGRLMPSLALKSLAVGLEREIMVLFDNNGIDEILLIDPEEEQPPVTIKPDHQGRGRVLVNHRGPGRGPFRHYSLADAYNNTFTDEEREQLKGSFLLLGATATGTNDIRPNPYDPAIDGVENHAAVIDNVLKGDLLVRKQQVNVFELKLVLIAGLLFTPVMIWGSALLSAFLTSAFVISLWYVDQIFWWGKGEWVYLAIPMMEIMGMFIVMTIYKFMSEEKDKKFLKEAFGSYISPELIDEMYGSGEPPKLGGNEGVISAFFTDIQSFSSFSEILSPTELVELLNEYLTAMTDILLEEKGTLDKYEGDAIIAFFGAPMDLEDHASRAVRVAVKMQEKLLELREKWVSEGDKWPPIVKEMRMRIGINSGLIVTGNMGSASRMNYTMMGDSVNLAARLEEAAKQYGIFTQISHFTKELCNDEFEMRELDSILVVGKKEPVTTFEVLGMKGQIDENLKNLQETFAQGLALYKEQKWDEAISVFEKSLEMEWIRFPLLKEKKTNPSEVYIKRCKQFKENPPPADWDGVFVLTEK